MIEDNQKLIFTVIKEDTGFSAYTKTKGNLIATQAEDMQELKVNISDALNLSFPGKHIEFVLDKN